MKKLITLLLCTLLFTGCDTLDISNTPTKKVEMFLNNYQILHEDVLKDLDNVINKEDSFDNNNKEVYKEIIKKQYKDLQYTIKEEKIDGDEATVTAEIIVKDFTKIINESQVYRKENITEFYEEETYNDNLYQKYLLENLKKAKEKVTYTLEFKLYKENKKWVLEQLSDENEDKILGIYNY